MARALHSPTACKTNSRHQQIGVHRRALLSSKHVYAVNCTLSLPCGVWRVLYFRQANDDELAERDVLVTPFVTREPPPSDLAVLFLHWKHHRDSHRTARLANSELLWTGNPDADLSWIVQKTYWLDGAGFRICHSQQPKGWWDAFNSWGRAYGELWGRSPLR